MLIDRNYHVEAPFHDREITAVGYDSRVWTSQDPGDRKSYEGLTVDERELICEYFDAYSHRRNNEPWGEWKSSASGLVVAADEVDAKVLTGYQGERLWASSENPRKKPSLKYLQKLGACADGIHRWHERECFSALASDSERQIGFDYLDQGDLLLVSYRLDPTLSDPLGFTHDFVPAADVLKFVFSHNSHGRLVSMLMSYAHRLGLGEEIQGRIFVDQAVASFGVLKPSGHENLDLRSQVRIAQSDRTIRGHEGLLDWPLECTPGNPRAVGLRKVGDNLEFYTCKSLDPGDQLIDETIVMQPGDLPILVKLIYENVMGEPLREVSDLIIHRFNLTT